jgi:prolyl oligopeptidase
MLARMRGWLVIACAACSCSAPSQPTPNAVRPSVATAVPLPPAPSGPPIARTDGTIDHVFGLDIADPYRWMESHDDERLAWVRAQADHTADVLAHEPDRDKLFRRVKELGSHVSSVWNVQLEHDRLVYSKLPEGAQLAKLVTRDAKGAERTLVDPELLGSEGHHASLNAYSLSPDGKLVAYVIAFGGGEVGELHVMDVATGKDLADVIPRIWGEGSANWLPDGKRFFYTQMAPPAQGADPMTGMVARLHVLGRPADADVTVLGRSPDSTLPMAAEEWPGVWQPLDSSWVVASIGGARSEARIAIAKLSELDVTGASKTPWRMVAGYADGVDWAVPHGDRLYLRTFNGAPNRKLISVPLAHPDLAHARIEIGEDPDAPMQSLSNARDAIYLTVSVNGRARLLRWPWHGAPLPVALREDVWLDDLTTSELRDGVVFDIQTWLSPGAYHAFDPKTGKVTPFGLASTSDASFADIVAEEVEVGDAKVPLTILRKRDLVADGSHPTIVSGYGAYGVSQSPSFNPMRLAWLEQGGVLAIAHVRGGGEKGRRWQDDGSREHKLNGVHDLIACVEYLVAQKWTTPGRLGTEGGSAGGILIGRAITERPDLFAAARIAVGMVNPTRIMVMENGANQKGEIGDPDTEAGFKSILAMDAYQHVKPRTAYPAVLFTIGLNDHRVTPWQTAKMAARMLAATTSGKPILVRVEGDAGHGIGSTRDQAYAERADVWSFMLAQFH